MKLRIIFILFLTSLLFACSSVSFLKSYPTICSDAKKQTDLHSWAITNYNVKWEGEESLLCKVAIKHEIHLDYTGDIVFTGDLLAIRNKLTDKKNAIALHEQLKQFVLDNQGTLTGEDFSVKVFTLLAEYPELGLIAPPLIGYLQNTGVELLEVKDTIMLLWYFDRNLKVLNGLEE